MSKRHAIDGLLNGHHYRCLTKDEMYYLVWQRPTSTVNGVQNARWCNAYVNSVRGFLLLPDNFSLPNGISMTNINVNKMSSPTNNYTISQWETLQDAGCRFFAAAGVVYPTSNHQYTMGNEMVCVWLSTISQSPSVDVFMCRPNRFEILGYGDRMNRLPVRLFDTDGFGFSISPTQQVDITRGHLQYYPADNLWRIAPNAYDYIGSTNRNYIDAQYAGWLDLFSYASSGWSGGIINYAPAGVWSSQNSDYYIGGDASQPMLDNYARCDWGIFNNEIISQ